MGRVRQSKAELIRHLHEHLEFLEASSKSFDQGHTGEAKRLAVTLRMLLHDTRQSKSLLGQLGWKSGHSFLDSAIPYYPRNLLPQHGLVEIQAAVGSASYHAPLHEGIHLRPYKFVCFPDWWNKTVISDAKRNAFNRRELILALCNKDGGAHVDSHLDQSYVDLSRSNSVGWVYQDDNGSTPVTEVERHSIRQMAYELSASVQRLLQKHGA